MKSARLTPKQQRDLIKGMNALVGVPTVETYEHKAGLIPPIQDDQYRGGSDCAPAYDRALAKKVAARRKLEAA